MPHSRRSFLQLSTAASAVLAFRIVTEPMLAHARRTKLVPEGAVMIDSNENPLGPCTAAREAVIAITPQGGRYLDPLTDQFLKQFAQSVGVNEEQVRSSLDRPNHCTSRSGHSLRRKPAT